MENLAVIIPVYNEEEIIETVINEWIFELDKLNIDYKIFAYNDGSKDKSEEILEKLASEKPQLVAINKENSWHGPTILRGYRENSPNFEWLLQIDSDREMSPKDFNKLWDKRTENDFLIAIRKDRPQSFTRSLISFISRICVKLFYGFGGPWDVNSPYRLMKSEKFIDLFNQIPESTLSPNIIISGYVAKKKIKFLELPIHCAQRKTGKSLNSLKLLKTATKSFFQTLTFSFIVK